MSIITHTTIGNCAVLTMNRPESLNAITSDMLNILESELDVIEKDDSRAVILTGAGRAFCPGSDIKSPPDDVRARIDQVHRLIRRLLEFPKLSIAAINGLALGGGLELALACTFRVAERDAKLGLPEIKIGLMPAYGGTALLPRLIGLGRAQEMMLGGRSIAGQAALSIGLVNSLFDAPDTAVQAAHDFIQPYCAFSQVPQRAIRDAILTGPDVSLTDALAHEYRLLESVSASEDCLEGVNAFIEKRPPQWKDR
jgi:enoyl-CoA hydratase/carnithine racemase